ncbi:HET-domain-containing protein [Podospora aff. communis PSN243]|uniref:HET-domain-containing protein n=1 Tax=Podospora aff. communis PSN243 TaxID=3040156 RepID=A0AAV9GJX1_9PEZI|nr:HET-domain-containing protein [Podospora aff. communis PSN243]
MRLLNSRTLEFEFFGSEESRPKYAILSHRWEDDERGFDKIQKCGEQAARDELAYFWIDTCCIDKTSSAELSEAINSMFRWYRKSELCYAYLSDELIAPPNVEFYDSSWVSLGNKADFWIYEAIHFRTEIPIPAITTGDLSHYSIAQKMSWAAGRETTRSEDLAYCLLGLFDINMPLLYGEGTKAFVRLQEEIIRVSDDMSIFAWTDARPEPYQVTNMGIRIPFHLVQKDNSTSQVTQEHAELSWPTR